MIDSDPYSQHHPAPAPAAHAAADAHGDEHHDHAVPLSYLVLVFAALLVLTAVTVGVRYIDLGEFNLLAAMAIAVVKGALVVAIFMHLWWDSRFNAIALIAGLLFVALFIGLAILDSHQYKPSQDQFLVGHPVQEVHLPDAAPVDPAAAPAAAH